MLQAANQAGFPVLPDMSWHWMRRFFATKFIERFPDKLSVLITLLGHMNPGTVHRYIRHSQAWMDNQISEVLRGRASWLSPGD
jgi:site-specific recombinase XerD